METKQELEKAIEKLRGENRDIRNKNLDLMKEADLLEKRRFSILTDIENINKSCKEAREEYKEARAKVNEANKELESVKADCAAETTKLKREWADLNDEAEKVKKDANLVSDRETKLLKDNLTLKEEQNKVVGRQAKLDQIEAQLKDESQKQDNRRKELDKAALVNKEADAQTLKDIDANRKEGERLVNISKSLEVKRQELDKMRIALNEAIDSAREKEKKLSVNLDDVDRMKLTLNEKILEAETSKKHLDSALQGLEQSKKEVEIQRLKLIKVSKEKMTEEILKQLEKEANV